MIFINQNKGDFLMKKIHIKVNRISADLGSFATKIKINNFPTMMFPTVAKYIAPVAPDNIVTKIKHENKIDLFNSMKVSIDNISYLVGTAALNSLPNLLMEADYNLPLGKLDSIVPKISCLSGIAYCLLQNTYRKLDTIPSLINVVVDNMITSLPITTYRSTNAIIDWEKKFSQSTHKITLFNFGKPVELFISFHNVIVLPDGLAGNIAIMNDFSGCPLKNNAKKGQLLHIDVGHSFVNFTVTNYSDPLNSYQDYLEHGIKNCIDIAADKIFKQAKTSIFQNLNPHTYMYILNNTFQSQLKKKFNDQLNNTYPFLQNQIENKILSICNLANLNISHIVFSGCTQIISPNFLNKLKLELTEKYSPYTFCKLHKINTKDSYIVNVIGMDLFIEKFL